MMSMKKILYFITLTTMALGLVACHEEQAAEQKHVVEIFLEGQSENILSTLQADLDGGTYNICIKADLDYTVELSGAFAKQWVTLGERQRNLENGYDVLPVTIAAIEDSYEERSAVIYISADGNVEPQFVTIRQGYDLFRQNIALNIKDFRTRYFVAGEKLELVAANPNDSEYLKTNGISLEYSLVVPEDPEAEVDSYNENHYADCELLPSDMYALSVVPSADGRKLRLTVNVDKDKVKSQDREKPFVLPLKVVAEQGLYESEMFYVTVPTYTTDVAAYSAYELKPQVVVNLNGYTINSDGMIARNHLLIYNISSGNDKAVLYCPGGGYGGTSADESKIEHLLGTNSTIATLLYRLPCRQWQGRYEFPVEDAYQALLVLEENAGEWGQYRKIGVSGRSAGGHLAGVTAAYHKDLVDFQILLYPVITMQPGKTHAGSTSRFLGDNPSQSLVDAWSVHKLVGEDTPRAFVAYATNDTVVPQEYNGAEMKSALQKLANRDRHHIQVYDYGNHSSSSWTGFNELLRDWMSQF